MLPPLTCLDSILLLLPALTGSHQLLHTFTSTVLLLSTLTCSFQIAPSLATFCINTHFLVPSQPLANIIWYQTLLYALKTLTPVIRLRSTKFFCFDKKRLHQKFFWTQIHVESYILHLTSCILHVAPYTLNLTCCLSLITSYTLHLTRRILYGASLLLYFACCILHVLDISSYTWHLTLCFL